MDLVESKNEEAALPKATVAKIIKELLPEDMRCSNETRDLVLECCTEFIHMISSEAQEVCQKENKKTMAPEHVIKALKALGFEDYVPEIEQVLDKHKTEQESKPKMMKRLADTGLSEEELKRQQEALFARARSNFEASHGQPSADPSQSGGG
eukprot:tig00001542_g9330.t1